MNLKHAKDTILTKCGRKFVTLMKSGLASLLVVTILLTVVFSVNWYQGVNAYNDPSSKSQTNYTDVSEFQKYRWSEIQSEIFGLGDLGGTVRSPAAIRSNSVKSGNQYFNWVNTGLTQWTGNSTTVRARSTNESIKYGNMTVNYYVFDVDTPAKFRYVIKNFNSLVSSSTKDVAIKINITADLDMGGRNNQAWEPVPLFNEAKDKFDFRRKMYIEGNGHTIYNLKIVSQYHSTNTSKQGCGLMASAPPFMVIKNLGFMSSMMLNCEEPDGKSWADDGMQSGLICAYTPQKMYLYNVHSSGGYYQNWDDPSLSAAESREFLGGIGGLVGRKNCPVIPQSEGAPMDDIDIGDTFFENCSTEKVYAYAENHVGGFSSFMCTKAYADEYTYGDDIPDAPEQYVFDTGFVADTMESSGKSRTERDRIMREESSSYPIMFKNCSSTDCELFSVGNDSGAFISCGTGHSVEGCFTNNTLYSRENSGGFIGRVDSTKTPMIMDSSGKYAISSVFRDCYSSGIIEGKFAMGGFTGLDNSWRWRTTIYEKATSRDDSAGTYLTDWGSTVYENCYSTAMVGMDYAGKYAGGFVGLDDNYNRSATIKADGKTFSGKGSFYINCYAAGEVGNILTTTDTDDPNTLTLENEYFRSYEGMDNKTDILNYYPTGGFAGVVGLDAYIYYRNNGRYYNDPTGVFHNCYYDVQTTAMHEMAIGLSSTRSKFTVDGKSTNVENTQYSMTGVTGLYTEESKKKDMDGLTDMDYMATDTSKWRYVDEYYPQLTRYMSSDIDYSNISDTTAAKLNNLTTSAFYIKENTTVTSSEYSRPVLSLGGAGNTKTEVAQMAQIVRAYRVSQASTATVLLDHWDIVMDPDSGLIGNEKTAWLPEARNKLTQYYVDVETGEIVANVKYYDGNTEVKNAENATRIDIVDISGKTVARINFEKVNGSINSIYTDTSTNRTVDKLTDIAALKNTIDEWRITYKNLDANTDIYQFKLEQGEGAVNFNYGKNGYNGANMQLSVPYEKSETTIRFHQSGIETNDYYIISECYNPETGTTVTDVLAKGAGATVPGGDTYLYLRGDFNNWELGRIFRYSRIDENGDIIYRYTYNNMPAGTHNFKVGAVNWDNGNYGFNGGTDNMSFTLSEQTDVTFEFNLSNKITSIIVADESMLSDLHLSKPMYLRGSFNNWGNSEAELNSAMMEYTGVNVYSYVASNLAKGTHEFKVGTSDWSEGYGKDGGQENMSITLAKKATVTFNFNYETKITSVIVEPNEALEAIHTTSTSNLSQKNLVVRGLMGDWDGNEYKMGTKDNINYTYTCEDLWAGDHSFKISDKDKTEWYGYDGGDDNMTLTLSQEADVTFYFNYNTKITTVSANPPEALESAATYTPPFEGLAVITSSDLTGKYDWEQHGNYKEASMDGELTDEDNDGWYEKTFTVDVSASWKYNKVYGYKIIENQNTETIRRYFYLEEPTKAGDTSIEVTFHYNEETDEAYVTTDDHPYKDEVHQYAYGIENFHVAGDAGLTGTDWLNNYDGTAGKMGYDVTLGRYTKTYTNIPAGTYHFLVVADANWSLGVKYGSVQDKDYSITLTQTADVTIYFNEKSGIITVNTNPSEALVQKQYVLSGTANLTGDKLSWSKKHNMDYDDSTGKYSLTFENVPCDENFMYKIDEKDTDSGYKQKFYLDSALYKKHTNKTINKVKIKIVYNGGVSKVIVYDDAGNVITKYIKSDYRILSYSVIGDKDLTGFEWGTDLSVEGEAKRAGEMRQYIPLEYEYEGIGSIGTVDDTYWIKEFTVSAPKNGKTYAFKIAANGTWDAGYNYGAGGLNGDNVIFTVAAPALEANSCVVSVIFNETQEKIYCINPDGYLTYDINYDTFDWYIIGTRELTSLESKISDKLVYDTVRDITSKFRFTSGMNGEDRGITWETNDRMNENYDFFDDVYFSLGYSVKNINSTTNFDSPVVAMEAEVFKNSEVTDLNLRDALSVQQFVEVFAPGKQWITVSTTGYGYSDAFTRWKKNILQYTEREANKEILNKLKDQFVSAFKGYTYNGAEITKNNVVDFCKQMTSASAPDDFKDIYDALKESYGDLLYIDSLMPSASESATIDTLLDFDECQAVVEKQLIVGKRNLRLIPTAYIEAGVDASVSVAKSDSSGTDENLDGSTGNLVRYENDTIDEYVSVVNNDGSDVEKNNYERYNLAFTAGYLVTDRIGLGIYNNYNNQGGVESKRDEGIQKYNTGTGIRDDLLASSRKVDQYFAMSTVFTMDDSYTDKYSNGVYDFQVDNNTANTYNNGLKVDALKQQTVIGPAYDRKDSADQTSTGKQAQTIVKVFRILDNEGKEEKVLMDPTANAKGVYADNYKKWTGGDVAFTADDIGEYAVRIYWAMSDGRYLVDEKKVVVRAITSKLSKEVDIDYTAKGSNKEIKYTLTYTNGGSEEAVNFAILDILPYNGDTRINTSSLSTKDNINTEMSNDSMTLKSITLRQSNGAHIRDLRYTTNKSVRNAMNVSDPTKEAAKELEITEDAMIGDSDGGWVKIGTPNSETGRYADTTYTVNKSSPVAIAASGRIFAPNQTVEVEYVVSFTELKLKDYITNNGYYDVISVEGSGVRRSGISNPVATAVIGRDIMGTAWLDYFTQDGSSEGEPILPGVMVSLYKMNSDGYYENTGESTKTDQNGAYMFEGLGEGTYRLVFSLPAGTVTIEGKNYNYQSFVLSKQHEEDDGTELNLGEALEDEFMIDTRVMPANEAVYSGNHNQNSWVNGVVDSESHSYQKIRQSIAFKVDMNYSFDIQKTGDTGEAIAGAEFILESKNGSTWEQVSGIQTYNYDDEVTPPAETTPTEGESTTATTAPVEKKEILYLAPNTNWKMANARFAAYFYKGDVNTWASMTATSANGLYSVEVPKGDWEYVIFCRMNPDTTENKWDNKWNQTEDLLISSEYNCFAVKEGTWDKGGGDWSKLDTGAAVAVEEEIETYATVAEKKVYLVPNDNWKTADARFAAYFFNDSGNTWASMEDSDNDGTYSVTIPDGDWKTVIFCRMNPGSEDNNWDNKWNQTSNLDIPTDGTNCYTVKEGTWDSGGGEWSTYAGDEPAEDDTPIEGEDRYTDLFVTDKDGKIKVIGLPGGSYRIREIKTVEGKRVLTSAIYFDLPYTVSSASDGTYVNVSRTENNKYYLGTDDDGNKYYSHVGFDIIDPSIFGLPTTGHNGIFITAIIGVALLAVAAILWAISKKKKATALNH